MIDAPHVKLRSSRVVRWPRVGASVALALGILAVDLTTTGGVGIGALYIITILLGTLTGPPRVGYIAGAAASTLLLLGLLKTPLAMTPWFVLANRAIALMVIWTTVVAIVRSREASVHLEERTRDLADFNYVLEKSGLSPSPTFGAPSNT